jgi:SAM-dependent methyltransferase
MENLLNTHWNNVYTTKAPDEVSWFQAKPETSLNFLNQAQLSKSARIIDVGGGDSTLVDHLLDEGYTQISVLDISSKALERAQNRLGPRAHLVTWIEADATTYQAEQPYDFWHDRAAFHFLTSDAQIEHYLNHAHASLKPGGMLVLGTFAKDGPTKCSGLDVRQYDEATMELQLRRYFAKIKCIREMHHTPTGKEQSFVFCSFKRPA